MTEPVNPDRACDRCRERRVKCDKRHPSCARCEKLGKPCPGYAKKRKFVDENETIRKKFEASAHVSKPATPSHDGAFSQLAPKLERETPTYLGTPVDSSALIIDTQPLRPQHRVPELIEDGLDDILGDVLDDTAFDPAWFDLDPASFYGQAGNSCGFLPNAPNIVDEVDKATDGTTFDIAKTLIAGQDELPPEDDWMLWGSEKQFQTSLIISDEREHEMAYLIRHFTEFIGPWMDLFDCERHFAQLVPLKALRDVLLKNAIAAVAAKQLGCIKGSRPFLSPQNQKPASMELIEYEDSIDWMWKAANYYDKAIMYSRVYLQQLSGSITAPHSPGLSASLSIADSDDLLLAVSIFSLYEYLDNADFGWIQHLTGLKSILSVLKPSVRSADHAQITLGRRASFWNFARADYQAAYIKKTGTLLDPDNLPIWLDSGLEVQPGGALYADPDAIAQDKTALSYSNQLVSHTLLWILLQTMNFLHGPQRNKDRAQEWRRLNGLLDAWQAARPRSFQPCARLRQTVKHHNPLLQESRTHLPVMNELFFSTPVCAATVQLYHFARLLLLMNNPEPQNSAAVVDEQLAHAYTIIGIALGRPHPAVRVEMVLPLYLAGSCLQDDAERQVVVDLLYAIGKDTGCEANGRIQELTHTWGWSTKHLLHA